MIGTILLFKGPCRYGKKPTILLAGYVHGQKHIPGRSRDKRSCAFPPNFEGYSFYNKGHGTQGLPIENQSAKKKGPPLHWANPKFYANRRSWSHGKIENMTFSIIYMLNLLVGPIPIGQNFGKIPLKGSKFILSGLNI